LVAFVQVVVQVTIRYELKDKEEFNLDLPFPTSLAIDHSDFAAPTFQLD
jgi:hypothetical protein